jgi:hypothetical protein
MGHRIILDRSAFGAILDRWDTQVPLGLTVKQFGSWSLRSTRDARPALVR